MVRLFQIAIATAIGSAGYGILSDSLATVLTALQQVN